MKKTITTIILFVGYCTLNAQSYEIDAFNNQTVTNCSGNGIFYDSGGPSIAYQNNEVYTVTFCPTSTNLAVRVDFTTFNLGTGDQLCVFDGNSTAAPNIGCYSSVSTAFSVNATNTSGCLTFQFTSNGINVGQGWVGNISCQVPCQTIIADIDTTSPPIVPADTGYIDICIGDAITFNGTASYPQNGLNYTQSNATSTFSWIIEGQTFTGQSVTHNFNNPGGYNILMEVEDIQGCKSINSTQVQVRVAPLPQFTGTNAVSDPVCLGDTVTLDGNIIPGIDGFAASLARGDSIFLPDGTGVCYQTTLQFTDFAPGQTLTNINDFLSLCVNMEHSWIGDLDLFLTCPNGTKITLHPFGAGGGGTNLGEPISFGPGPGKGYDYCWTPTATQTWAQAISTGTGVITVNGEQTLAPGNYASSSPMTALVGCPLNGIWEIEICDNLGIDDGYIFNWGINFAPNLYPNIDTFAPQYGVGEWLVPGGTLLAGDTVTYVPTSAGTFNHTYSATNDFGCTEDTTITIDVLGPPIAPTLTCASVNATQITVSRNNVPNAVKYEINVDNGGWQQMPTTSMTFSGFTPVQSVFFQVRAVGPAGCDLAGPTDTITCTTADCQLTVNLNSLTQVSCSGAADGAAVIGATTNVMPLTYTLDGTISNNTGSFNNLTIGTHTVVVEDGNTCQDSVIFNVTSPVVMNINATSNNVSCYGEDDGFASVSVSGGSLPYSFAWSNLGNTGTIIDLFAGDYIVTVTDNNGCQEIDTVTITQPDSLGLSFTTTNVSCFNGNDGSATANVSGGVPGYTYSWSSFPVQTTQTATNLFDNIYNVTVTDGNGCTIIGDTTITEPPLLTLSIDTNRVTCFGTMDGEATTTIGGGTPPYSYTWSNGDTRPITDTLNGGFHSVTVTDSLGCTVSANFGIYEPPQIINTFTTQQVSCFGLSDGSATVTASGGIGSNYNYQWSTLANSQTGITASNLSGGFYRVTTTDSEGCQQADDVFVLAPVLVFVDTIWSTPTVCFYSNEGTASTIGSGGSGNLYYSWSNGQSGPSLSNLYRGQYNLTVSDDFGCIAVDSVVVQSPDSIEIQFAATPLLCGGDGTGTVSSTVLGGVAPYNYNWNTSSGLPNLTGLQAGVYALTITDASNCIQEDSVLVTEPSPIIATTTYVEPLCFGDANGSARIFPSGGNGGYTFSWATTPVQTDTTAVGLTAGIYNYTVLDSNNCAFNGTVTVTEPSLLISSIAGTNISCRDSADGEVIVSPMGGSYPYVYSWSSSTLNDSIISPLDTGWHYVTITDIFGCTTSDSINLIEPSYVTSSITGTDLSCFQSGDGTATVVASGGVGNYSYVWSNNNQTTVTATNLDAGWNYVTITDGNNCPKTDSVQLNQPTEIITSGSSTVTLCYGDNTGTATITPSGGTPGYTYSWNTNPVQIGQTANNLSAGTYYVTVADALNCPKVDSVVVNEPNELIVNLQKTDMSCFDLEDGTVTALPQGGTPGVTGFTYLWNTTQTLQTIGGLDQGMYSVVVTDSNGCTATNSIQIFEPTLLTSMAISYPSSCFGGNDGSAVVVASGGTPDINGRYNYLWNSTFPQNTDSAVSLIGGLTYSVIVTDDNGCQDTSTVTISQPSQITFTSNSTLTSCHNTSDGTATVIAAGGTSPFTYQWDTSANNQTTSTANNLAIGFYKVTITDTNGCEENTNVTVTGPDEIEILLATSSPVSCKDGADGGLSAIAAGGTGVFNYQWDANANNQTSPIANNLAAGIYELVVTDANGCQSTASFEVTEPTDYLNTSLSKTDISCFGENDGQIVMNTVGGTLPYSYKIDTGFTSIGAYSGLYAGDYIIQTQDGNGCETVDTIEVVEPAPFTVFLPFDTTIAVGTDIQLIPVLDNGIAPFTYNWQPRDTALSCFTCRSPYTIDLLFERVFKLKVTDANGCVSTDEIVVRIEQNRAVFVASGFTPNDDGVNDRLFVQGSVQVKNVTYFKVYDRWGEIVFDNRNFSPNVDQNGWDGYFKGTKAPKGVYGWIAEVEYIDGETRVIQGNTTLIW